mmetsp:Transcript_7513/g.14696  ORF Transcript_7513/g.14696 Transcript_7513/m.14696 type:complete len:221 (-) Transcript_7513:1943-2605(-)
MVAAWQRRGMLASVPRMALCTHSLYKQSFLSDSLSAASSLATFFSASSARRCVRTISPSAAATALVLEGSARRHAKVSSRRYGSSMGCRTMSAADGRWVASGCIMAARSSHMAGEMAAGSGAKRPSRIAWYSSPPVGSWRSEASSYMLTPSAKTSLLVRSWRLPCSISLLRYRLSPSSIRCSAASAGVTRPKSPSLYTPRSVQNMFSGLTSMCARLVACM